jgi:uncharacterized protein YqhQ
VSCLSIGGRALDDGVQVTAGNGRATARRHPDDSITVEWEHRQYRHPRGVASWPVVREILAADWTLHLTPVVAGGSRAANVLGALLPLSVLVIYVVGFAGAEAIRFAPWRWVVCALTLSWPVMILREAVRSAPSLTELRNYHAAEHQAIQCYTAGGPVTVEHAARFSPVDVYCGSGQEAWRLIALIGIAVALDIVGPHGSVFAGLRALAATVLAIGVGPEINQFVTRHHTTWWGRQLVRPGLRLQRRLSVGTATPAHLEVAVAAVTAATEPEGLEALGFEPAVDDAAGT